MLNASIEIQMGNAMDYTKVLGKTIEYQNGSAKIQSAKNAIKVSLTATDPKSLLNSMSSVIRQLTIVGNVLEVADKVSR